MTENLLKYRKNFIAIRLLVVVPALFQFWGWIYAQTGLPVVKSSFGHSSKLSENRRFR